MIVEPTDTIDTSAGPSTEDQAIAMLMARTEPKPVEGEENVAPKDDAATPASAEDADGNLHVPGDTDDPEAQTDGDGADPETDGPDPQVDEEDPNAPAEEAPKLPEAPKPAPVSDDTEIAFQVHGKDEKFTVGQLKRIAADRVAIQAKSQEADLVGGRAAAALDAIRAQLNAEREPYLQVDWMQLQNQVIQGHMDPATFDWHRENAHRIEQRYAAVEGAARNFTAAMDTRNAAELQRQAVEAYQELKTDVPDWSDDLYGNVQAWAVEQGLEAKDVAEIRNAKVIKILLKAYRADTAKVVAAKKLDATPAPVKSGEAQGDDLKQVKQRKLEAKLKTGKGTEEDAIALLMGRWN